MNCESVEQVLELYVLGELSDAECADVAEHLRGCAACRAAEAELRAIVHDIRQAGRPVRPSPELQAAVCAAARSALATEARRRLLLRRAEFVAAAAALLLITLSVWAVWRIPGRRPGPEAGPGSPPADAKLSVPERWQYRGARAVPTSVADELVVHGQTMYLLAQGDVAAGVAAIDIESGELLWRSDVPSIGYLAADDRRVFCLGSVRPQSVDLMALNASDGGIVWRYSCEELHPLRAGSRPVPLSDDRVCWTADTVVHLVDADTGEALWSSEIAGEGPLSAVAVKENTLYVASSRGLHALNIQSGKPMWREELDREQASDGRPLLALSGRYAYVAQERSRDAARLVCFNLDTRRVVWKKTMPKVQHILAGDGILYVRNHGVHALDAAAGAARWTYAAAGCSPLSREHGMLYFTDAAQRGRLVALDERTGAEAWEIARVRSCNAFTKVGSTGYIKTLDGVVHAFTLDRRGAQ